MDVESFWCCSFATLFSRSSPVLSKQFAVSMLFDSVMSLINLVVFVIFLAYSHMRWKCFFFISNFSIRSFFLLKSPLVMAMPTRNVRQQLLALPQFKFSSLDQMHASCMTYLSSATWGQPSLTRLSFLPVLDLR